MVLAIVNCLAGCYYFNADAQFLSYHDPSEAVVASSAAQEDPEMLALQADPLWSDAESLKAMVISDLHYTEDDDPDHTLVPGIAEAERLTDAIIAQVIDRHPDVLIMTGDNTNSGKAADVAGLVTKLQKIRDQGISIIMTTGNHDFDLMDAGAYEAAYYPLLDPVDRDPASLSYTAIIKNVVFLAMDDHDEKIDWQGAFSVETLQWIEDMLEKYRDHTVIFLTHHNVLYSYGQDHDYTHLIGNLAVDKNRIIYYAEPLDIAAYDSKLKAELDRLDQEYSDYMDQVFAEILDQEELRGLKRRRVMNLIGWFWHYHNEGTLAEHRLEFTEDPSYERMIRVLWNYNYGPWMKNMIETTEYNTRQLSVS